jgi:hypothetical protein
MACFKGIAVNQALLRLMAEERLLDSAALLAAGRWAFAYYTAGYAVECGLKCCVLAQMIHTGGVFSNRRFAEECFTHDFGTLVKLAGLKPQLDAEHAANPAFVGYWGTAILWNETSRYDQKTQAEAEALFLAISDNANGAMQWIRNYW